MATVLPISSRAYEPAAAVRYLADVARVEAAWTRAYHAEDAAPLTVADLAAMPADELGAARLMRHPAAALVRSAHPVGSIWAAHQAETVEPPREWTGRDGADRPAGHGRVGARRARAGRGVRAGASWRRGAGRRG